MADTTATRMGASLEGVCGLTSDSMDDLKLPNTAGFRASGSVFVQGSPKVTHEFTFGLAPQWGSKTTIAYFDGLSVNARTKAFMMPITLGYKPHFNLSEKATLFLSGRIGYAMVDADVNAVARYGSYSASAGGDSGIDGGFLGSIGAGFCFNLAKETYLTVGYEFQATRLKSDDSEVGDHTFKQHVISCGVGVRF